jgi:hypothetical protein
MLRDRAMPSALRKPSATPWRALLCAASLWAGLPARAHDLRLRADLVGASAFPSVDVDRSADAYLHLDLEVELPLWGPFTLGARATPLYLYKPGAGPWNYGLGFGLTSRAYFRGEDHQGLFAGIGVTTLRTHRTFEGDSSRLNFLSQLSFGWQSTRHWHALLVFEHLSNAWTTGENHGVNGLGAAIGVDW